MSEEISHGRGGAGNIRPDSTPYADGEIVREGPVGDQGDGSYSFGRGGAGNIDSPGLKPTNKEGTKGDADVIPETALREGDAAHESYHTGRGGSGNVHQAEGHHHHEGGLKEKLKEKILGKKDE